VKHDKHLNGFRMNGNGHVKFSFAGRWPEAMRTPAYAAKLTGWALAERPDLIITTHLNFTPAANLIQQMSDIPFWTVAHGIEAWGIEQSRIKRALRNSNQILAVSNFTRNRLLNEQKLSPDQISILPNTVDEQRFDIAAKPEDLLQRYKLKDDQPIVLTVSRLVRSESYKGYDSVIRALPAIRKVIPNIHYVLVGTGNDRERIAQMIVDLDLKDCVTLAGYVADEELGAHYNLCDVFAMPSKREGFGIVYLEAMACGKPTLGGNKDGAVDALMNGELGALVDPDDTIEIAGTLISILKKQYPLQLMYEPERLRNRVLELYGYETFRKRVAERLSDFFA
jgi:glycosyltransferase involved in cell wall biosynthesis